MRGHSLRDWLLPTRHCACRVQPCSSPTTWHSALPPASACLNWSQDSRRATRAGSFCVAYSVLPLLGVTVCSHWPCSYAGRRHGTSFHQTRQVQRQHAAVPKL
ncbi:hypothetical protein Micbo1qcDRAFT_169555, partial [Microdochium bolleyi]